MAGSVGQLVADLRKAAVSRNESIESAVPSVPTPTVPISRSDVQRSLSLVAYDSDSSVEIPNSDTHMPSVEVCALLNKLLEDVDQMAHSAGGEKPSVLALPTIPRVRHFSAHSYLPSSLPEDGALEERRIEEFSEQKSRKLTRSSSAGSFFPSCYTQMSLSPIQPSSPISPSASLQDVSSESVTAAFTFASPSISPRRISTVWEIPINISSDEGDAPDAASASTATLAIGVVNESDEENTSQDDCIALSDGDNVPSAESACYVPLTQLSPEEMAAAGSSKPLLPVGRQSLSPDSSMELLENTTPDDSVAMENLTTHVRAVSTEKSESIPTVRRARVGTRQSANMTARVASSSVASNCTSPDERATSRDRNRKRPTKSGDSVSRTASRSRSPTRSSKQSLQPSRRSSRSAKASQRSTRSSSTGHSKSMDDPGSGSRKSRKRKRVISSSSSSDSDSDDDSESPSNDAPTSRPKGDRETRARDSVWANPSTIFPHADLAESDPESCKSKPRSSSAQELARQHAKSIPQAFIAPSELDDRQRPQLKRGTLTAIVELFVASSRTTLHLAEYQHRERLQIVRQLLPIVYSNEHNVEPMLRFLQQNGRGPTDPLVMLATVLRPELIDTRLSTQSSSANLTVFNYLVPLLMQRWGLMVAGVAAQVQWRGLGLMYNNWNWFGRWPELLIVAPTAVEQMSREIYAEQSNAPASEFQTRLGKKFVLNPDALASWCHVRRCAKAVQNDKSGNSLYTDLIVPPLSVWLRLLSARIVAAALITADEAALVADLNSRVAYPDLAVYQQALTTLTQLLAGSNVNVTFGRLVDETLARARAAPPDGYWVTYDGGDPVVEAGVRQLQENPPTFINTSVVRKDVSMLAVQCQWPGTTIENPTNLQFLFPLPPRDVSGGDSEETLAVESLTDIQPTTETVVEEQLPVAPETQQQSARTASSNRPKRSRRTEQSDPSAAAMPPPTGVTRGQRFRGKPSVSASSITPSLPHPSLGLVTSRIPLVAVCITGVRGSVSETRLWQLLSGAGRLCSLFCDEAAGAIWATYQDASNTTLAIFSIYGTVTRAQHIRAVEVSGEGLTSAYQAGKLTPNSCGKQPRQFKFPVESTKGELATSLLLARPPSPATYKSIPAPSKELLKIAAAVTELIHAVPDEPPTVVETGGQLVALSEAPYDFFATRLEHCALFEDPSSCSSEILLFLLREVVLEHLQLNATDSVYVTPPNWFGQTTRLEEAVQSNPLYNLTGESINVAHSRALLCPLFLHDRPLLVFIAFPKAFDVTKPHLIPPFIWIFGTTLSSAALRKLLVFLLFRLETMLEASTAIMRCKVACIKLNRTEGWTGQDKFDTFLEFAHAARISLKLLSTVESLPFSLDFFTDADILATSRLRMRSLIQGADGNPQLADIVKDDRNFLLSEWRELAALSRRRPSTQWNDELELAAYNEYVGRRYSRLTTPATWTTIKTTPSTELVQQGYEQIAKELQESGEDALRAYCARLQQLRRRGFYILGSNGFKFDLCRRATEHVTIAFPEFVVRQQERVYSAEDEYGSTLIGWSTAPNSNF